MENDLDNFKNQEIEFTIEDMVLKLKKLKKKELVFLTKRNKHFKKGTTKTQIQRNKLETEKWISLIEKIKDEKDETKVEAYFKAVNDYLELKNSLICYLPILETLDVALAKAREKIKKCMPLNEQIRFSPIELFINYEEAYNKYVENSLELDNNLIDYNTRAEYEKALAQYEKAPTKQKESDRIICVKYKKALVEHRKRLKSQEELYLEWQNLNVKHEEFKEVYGPKLRMFDQIKEIIKAKETIKNLLNENKEKLKKVLEVFGEPCIGIVSQEKKGEKLKLIKEDFIFCPNCGVKIEISRLS